MKVLKLYCAGGAEKRRFGITAGPKLDLWWGKFFPKDQGYTGDGLAANISAVEKGYWIGWKVAEGLGESIRLELVTWLQIPDSTKRRLYMQGKRKGVDVRFSVEGRTTHPAVRLVDVVTDWQKADLARAARCVEERPPCFERI